MDTPAIHSEAKVLPSKQNVGSARIETGLQSSAGTRMILPSRIYHQKQELNLYNRRPERRDCGKCESGWKVRNLAKLELMEMSFTPFCLRLIGLHACAQGAVKRMIKRNKVDVTESHHPLYKALWRADDMSTHAIGFVPWCTPQV